MSDYGFCPCDPPDLTQIQITAETLRSKERKDFVVITAISLINGLTLTYRKYDSGKWTQWQKL